MSREPRTAQELVASAPVHAEPIHGQPVQSESAQVEAIQPEAIRPGPVQAGPVQAEPVQADPLRSAPAKAKAALASAAHAVAKHVSRQAVLTRSPEESPPVVPANRPRPLARRIVTLFVGVHALLAFGGIDWSHSQLLTVIGFVSVSAAAVWLGLSGSDRLPLPRTLGILGLCVLTAVVMSIQVSPVATGPFAHWYLGAITLVLVILAVRGRLAAAWIAYGGLAVIAVVWTISYGLTAADGLMHMSRHAATLLAATLFSVGLKRSAETLKVLHRERTERAVADATAVAAIEEREAHLARVNALARPTLDLLARSYELDDEMRAECLLVEATLRDAMRGRSLFLGPVIRAARAARLRGVEVTLLDDSGDQPPGELAAVAFAVAGELSLLDSGRFTARVLPADRAIIATIVVEAAAEHRILVVTPSGEVRDG